MGARLHSLRQSSDSYPACLVLLEGEVLIGHARVSRVLGSRSAFVESVVVRDDLRGKGYGRALMEGVECYAQARGFTRLYLTTHDKQHFYAHLGYVLSQPVQNVGTLASFMPMELLHKICRTAENDGKGERTRKHNITALSNNLPPSPSPPPAPPPPPNKVPFLSPSHTSSLSATSSATHLSPPAPTTFTPPQSCSFTSSAPPPAPVLPSSSWAPVKQTLEQTPYTDPRGLPVFWMHKNI